MLLLTAKLLNTIPKSKKLVNFVLLSDNKLLKNVIELNLVSISKFNSDILLSFSISYKPSIILNCGLITFVK